MIPARTASTLLRLARHAELARLALKHVPETAAVVQRAEALERSITHALIRGGRSMKPRQCFYVPAAQNPAEHGGYVPSLVVENEPGHSPMAGNPEQLQAPWVWGATLDEARAACAKANQRLGLSEADVNDIVLSSMAARAGAR